MKKIFVLEDDASLIDGLQYTLERNGYDLDFAVTVREAYTYLQDFRQYDLLLLDAALPDGTGYEVCEHIRKQDASIPIIFLTAADEEVNIIRGLDCGADDYITKPFKLGELCARIKALLRRSGLAVSDDTRLICGDISIDLTASRVQKGGITIELTGAEYKLLCLLIRNADLTVTRNMILDELWDHAGNFVDDNTLSVYIRRLREKIEDDPSCPRLLTTVRGFGYRWNKPI